MFGSRSICSTIKTVLVAADQAEQLIGELYERDPTNETFEQAGMLDGRKIIQEFIDYNEWGLGLQHLLYMIHESEIKYPPNDLQELHFIAKLRGIRNFYDQHDAEGFIKLQALRLRLRNME
jgi:hypothetical protein